MRISNVYTNFEGICVFNGTSVIKNNLIVGNSAIGGGGVLVELGTNTSSPSESNNQGRRSSQSNGLNSNQYISKVTQSETILVNNTIINNTATYGGGIRSVDYTPELVNCILWGNTAPNGSQISGSVNVVYSDVEGGWTGEGNINADPLFSDTLFHLSDSSLCIGAAIDSIDIGGTWYYCPVTDIEGNPRPNPPGSMPDIGACESPLATPVVGVESDLLQIPDEYSLAQNYPNPFNPVTTIKYGILERSFVELKLFDILGREVEVLVNEEQDVAFYEIQFNAVELSSGIYFYRLKAASFVETKKMFLMK